MDSGEKVTPMMKQFLELKTQYTDCILLFRAGDFYETFYDDAKTASQVLGITLTKRGETPMAGVPFHSITPYIRKLLQNNYKVAMCEQLEDPKKAKGLVKRGVTRIITPGTVLEDEFIQSFENNYLLCIYAPKDITEKFGLALVDITTAECLTAQVKTLDEVKTFIRKYQPNELILNESSFTRGLKTYIQNTGIYFNFLSDVRFNINYANEILKKQFSLGYKELGLDQKEFSAIAIGALLFYIYKLQKLDLSHINKIKEVSLQSSLMLDSITLRNLEITENLFLKDKKKTLFGILNNTKTASGARQLKRELTSPFLEKKIIEERFDAIEECNECILERNEVRELLEEVSDIERITSRISSAIASPRDLLALKNSLLVLPKIKELLRIFQSNLFMKLRKVDTFPELNTLLERAISEDAPAHTRDLGYIKRGFNKELDTLHELAFNSKDFLKNLEEEERLRTGIATLKIRYNKIFGYYIEIPKAQQNKVPEDYETKQTLVNATRYIKPELREKEEEILSAEEKMKALELELFTELLQKLKSYTKKLQELSSQLALLDVLTTQSLNSQLYSYTRPRFSEKETRIIEGRNPLVEQFVQHFTPHDALFDEKEKIKIITGPNMSGKSTFLRELALIVLMAQAGSFVPAKSATLKLYDRIFTRIGAHDELSEGQSTFMVEMSETANILNNASKKSLVLLDEIGRGTSTYDGLSIAWAVVEEIYHIGCDMAFATHYHQLNELTTVYPNIANYHIVVREEGESIEFIHKIEKGGTDKSYGIHVGSLAGIPQRVLERAKEIQENIEGKESITIKQEFKRDLSRKNKGSIEEKSKNLGEFL